MICYLGTQTVENLFFVRQGGKQWVYGTIFSSNITGCNSFVLMFVKQPIDKSVALKLLIADKG